MLLEVKETLYTVVLRPALDARSGRIFYSGRAFLGVNPTSFTKEDAKAIVANAVSIEQAVDCLVGQLS